MSNPKWLPKTPKAKLGRLVEECGEVLKCIGKAERFGMDTRYDMTAAKVTRDPGVESNREAMLREINDLIFAAQTVAREFHKPRRRPR